jgi:hypothetical protein
MDHVSASTYVQVILTSPTLSAQYNCINHKLSPPSSSSSQLLSNSPPPPQPLRSYRAQATCKLPSTSSWTGAARTQPRRPLQPWHAPAPPPTFALMAVVIAVAGERCAARRRPPPRRPRRGQAGAPPHPPPLTPPTRYSSLLLLIYSGTAPPLVHSRMGRKSHRGNGYGGAALCGRRRRRSKWRRSAQCLEQSF